MLRRGDVNYFIAVPLKSDVGGVVEQVASNIEMSRWRCFQKTKSGAGYEIRRITVIQSRILGGLLLRKNAHSVRRLESTRYRQFHSARFPIPARAISLSMPVALSATRRSTILGILCQTSLRNRIVISSTSSILHDVLSRRRLSQS